MALSREYAMNIHRLNVPSLWTESGAVAYWLHHTISLRVVGSSPVRSPKIAPLGRIVAGNRHTKICFPRKKSGAQSIASAGLRIQQAKNSSFWLQLSPLRHKIIRAFDSFSSIYSCKTWVNIVNSIMEINVVVSWMSTWKSLHGKQ